jgi:methylene-tetrahydromethanopterin dehydrogenase
MADKFILHMLSPLKHASPFDAHMALDAGYDAVLPYTEVTLEDVTPLVQDAIFSRPPKAGVRTGIFFGGKDALLALDMMEAAKKAMVPPFAASLFADPAGSFTTAAAMLARIEALLAAHFQRTFQGTKVAVFGATGVVGFAASVIAALEGAEVRMVGHDGLTRVARAAAEISQRFGVAVEPADGSDETRKTALVAEAEVVMCAGKAGVRILSAAQLAAAQNLLVAADVNAVPPSGIEGVDVMADGSPLGFGQALGLGALAIGRTKYQVESGLFRQMIAAEKPVQFDFRDAFALARRLVAEERAAADKGKAGS